LGHREQWDSEINNLLVCDTVQTSDLFLNLKSRIHERTVLLVPMSQ